MVDIKCDVCGKTFSIGNREDGLPNGLTFVASDGKPLTLCADCIIEIGDTVAKAGLADKNPFKR